MGKQTKADTKNRQNDVSAGSCGFPSEVSKYRTHAKFVEYIIATNISNARDDHTPNLIFDIEVIPPPPPFLELIQLNIFLRLRDDERRFLRRCRLLLLVL